MTLFEVLNQCKIVYVDPTDPTVELNESAIRQFKRTNANMVKKYRCLAGPRKGKLTSNPAGCGIRKDPKKVQKGKKIQRSKKNLIQRQSKVTKRQALSKLVTRLNRRLSGK